MASQEDIDKNILLKFFPLEIWINILLHVKWHQYSPVSNSTAKFKGWLIPLRTQIMFPDVAKIMFRCHLKISDLIPIRRVCQTWKDAVNFGLNNWNLGLKNWNFGEYQSNDQFRHLPFQVTGRYADWLRGPEELVEFTEHFDSSCYVGNPFITSSVVIAFPAYNEILPEFYEALFQFLPKFGHHIHYCLLNVLIRDSLELVNFYKQLGTMLKFMPNLRFLQVECGATETMAKSDLALLKRALTEHPIPAIHKLEHLKPFGLPESVLLDLVEKNQQISVVESQLHNFQHLQIYLQQMPNLKALAIDMHIIMEFLLLRDDPVNCRVTKLNIQMELLEMRWADVFAVLNHKFGCTLEELCISLPKNGGKLSKISDSADALILPKLKNLWITVPGPTCLDFLLPLKDHLEQFSILFCEFNDQTQGTSEGTIRFFEAGDSIYQSNVWTLFPKLDKLYLKRWNTPILEGNRMSWAKLKHKYSLKRCPE